MVSFFKNYIGTFLVLTLTISISMSCQDDATPSRKISSQKTTFARPLYTEERNPCRNFNPLKFPLFGDIHVHTSRSLDAGAQDTRTTPYQSYQFAKGERIPLHPWKSLDESGKANVNNMILEDGKDISFLPKNNSIAQRSLQLGRPLDFAMVSDHTEFFGETRLCADENLDKDAHQSKQCKKIRKNLSATVYSWLKRYLSGLNPSLYTHNDKAYRRYKFCGKDGKKCVEAAKVGWQETIDAAEYAYDRSENCRFTSFIGYEYTLSPFSGNLHRNVVFRNSRVPDHPISAMDAKNPESLWKKLKAACTNNKDLLNDNEQGCEVFTVPHNSNLSNDRMFSRKNRKMLNGSDQDQSDFTSEYAKTRQEMEPLIEIYQHKGDSECRYYKPGSLFHQKPTIDNADEFCSFEKLPYDNLMGEKENMFDSWLTGGLPFFGAASSTYPQESNFVRYALKRGLKLENDLGINPFKYGLIGSTDTHTGAPGSTNESAFLGHGGASGIDKDNSTTDSIKQFNGLVDQIGFSGGGLAVVWSEENSRDYIFESMKKRETYATSGTRIILRFFGGWNFNNQEICNNVKYTPDRSNLNGGDFVQLGYQAGVPMGSDLLAKPSQSRAPSFAVAALKDNGSNKGEIDQIEASTPLERIQIVKGWVDSNGKLKEKVFNVAGISEKDSISLNTCMPIKSQQQNSLCTVWTDPEFKENERAFYYARVLEAPVCRWSWRQCIDFAKYKDPTVLPLQFFKNHCSSRRKIRKLPEGYQDCCLHNNLSDINPKNWEEIQRGTYPPTIQERAWSSPIWYSPVQTLRSGH